MWNDPPNGGINIEKIRKMLEGINIRNKAYYHPKNCYDIYGNIVSTKMISEYEEYNEKEWA